MASATTIIAPRINLKLTSNDAAVLHALFDNGEGSFSSSDSTTAADPGQTVRTDASLPSFPLCSVKDAALQSLKDRELAIIRRIQEYTQTPSNQYSVQEPTHILKQAIDDLSSLIAEHPDYPPLYANRAQALRTLIQLSASSLPSSSTETPDKDAAIFHPENINTATQLLSDLSKAISLASPSDRKSNSSVSPAQARLLSNTYTHRGYILLKAGKIRKEEEEEGTEGNERRSSAGPEQLLRITSRDELEEMASQDFFQAGRYGNEVAKQLSVQTNPYAKMCGAIVKEALKKEIEEFQS